MVFFRFFDFFLQNAYKIFFCILIVNDLREFGNCFLLSSSKNFVVLLDPPLATINRLSGVFVRISEIACRFNDVTPLCLNLSHEPLLYKEIGLRFSDISDICPSFYPTILSILLFTDQYRHTIC